MKPESIGVIGLGSMGSMLADGFLRTGAVSEERLFVYTRTGAKAARLKREHPAVTICPSLDRLVAECGILALCVPPKEAVGVLAALNDACAERDANRALRIFEGLGEAFIVGESKIVAYTDVTSCGPGILSAVFQEFVEAAVRVGKLPRKRGRRGRGNEAAGTCP